MTKPNEQLISTITKALERYHEIKSEPTDLPGMNSQRMVELSFDLKQITRNFPEWLRALLEENERLNEENKNLESLGEDYEEKLTKQNDEICNLQDALAEEDEIPKLKLELQQTREELELIKYACSGYEMSAADAIAERNDLQAELEQVKAERDDARKDAFISRERLARYRTELSAKDKVLEEILKYPEFEHTNNGDRFYKQMKDIARTILSQYTKGEPNEK